MSARTTPATRARRARRVRWPRARHGLYPAEDIIAWRVPVGSILEIEDTFLTNVPARGATRPPRDEPWKYYLFAHEGRRDRPASWKRRILILIEEPSRRAARARLRELVMMPRVKVVDHAR